jgi:hypothetical protein
MLKATKFYFDNLFQTLWTTTPIQYAGQEFDGHGLDQWVNIVYKPLRSSPASISGTAAYNYGQLYIVCWAENDVDVMGLGDNIVEFMQTEVDNRRFKINGYSVIDHGWDDSNKVFLMFSFQMQEMVGYCAKPVSKDCTISIGKTTGLPFDIDGVLLPPCPVFKKV